MKKVRWMMMAAIAASTSVACAQGSDELAALQKQLNELSAKIAQLEAANAEKIAKLEADSAAKIAKLEEADAKIKIPAWVNDTKFKGDFRYRYEGVEAAGKNSQDRQRVRLRVGAYGTVNDYVDYGIRLATGGASATSANQTIDGGTKKEIMLDQYYVDLHPNLLMGAHLVMGKMPQPWIDRTGLIWDGDLNPEGLAVTYKNTYSNDVTLMANAGSFVVKEYKGDDLQLWAGQVAGESKVGGATVRLGMSEFYYQRAGYQGAGAGLTRGGLENLGHGLS